MRAPSHPEYRILCFITRFFIIWAGKCRNIWPVISQTALHIENDKIFSTLNQGCKICLVKNCHNKVPHSINGGILLNNEGGIKRFDSLAVENNGNICVGTLFNGGVTVISPSGELVEFIKFEDPYITNICFGSKDLQTAYITASYEGNLLEVPWVRKGLALNFLNK